LKIVLQQKSEHQNSKAKQPKVIQFVTEEMILMRISRKKISNKICESVQEQDLEFGTLKEYMIFVFHLNMSHYS